MEKHIHIHLHRRTADRKAKDTSLELALATKEVRKLQNAGVTGHYVILQRVMRMLVGQGFGEQYAQKVAEEAIDLMFSAADSHFTKYDPREAHRLDDEIKEVEQQIAKHKARPTPPAITIRDLEQILAKLKRERAKYHDTAHGWVAATLRKPGSVRRGFWNGQKFVETMENAESKPGYDNARLQMLNAQVEVNGKVVAGERKTYREETSDSKLEELEQELDALEAEIEKLEDRGQSPSRAQLDKRKDLQGAIAVIKSARKTGDSSAAEIEKQIAAQERLIAATKSRNASEAVLAPMARRLGVLKEELEKARASSTDAAGITYQGYEIHKHPHMPGRWDVWDPKGVGRVVKGALESVEAAKAWIDARG